MDDRKRAVAKTIAIGVSAGLFALAITQAQPGCDAGGSEKAPAKAETPRAAPVEKTAEPAKAEAPDDDASARTLGDPMRPPTNAAPEEPPPDDAAVEAAVAPEAAEPEAADPDAKADARKKKRPPKKAEETKERVFLPATKSGAFIPREPEPQQQAANPPPS